MNEGSAHKIWKFLEIATILVVILIILSMLTLLIYNRVLKVHNPSANTTKQSTESTKSAVNVPSSSCETYSLNDSNLDKGTFQATDKSYIKLSTKLYKDLYLFKTDTLKVVLVNKKCAIGSIQDVDNLDVGHSIAIINPTTKPYFGGIDFKESTVSMTHVRWNENIVLYVF